MNSRILVILIAVGIIFIQSCDKQLSTTPPEDPPPNGLIKISSKPSGFQIWLNGRNTGRVTPDSISWINSGEYAITMKRNLWKDTSFSLTAVEDGIVSKDINYFTNPTMYGSIKFTSDPAGADVYLNDSLLNFSTPSTLTKVLPGKYRVRYSREDNRDGNFIVEVKSSSQANAFIKLRDTTVWVDYQTHNSSIPYNSLSGITVDSNNVKWISTLEHGIMRYDEKQFQVFNTSNSQLPSNRVYKIEVDKFNKKWIGTDRGLAIFDEVNWEVINSSNSPLTNNTITAIEFNPFNETVQIGLADNIITIDGGEFFEFRFPSRPVIVSSLLTITLNRTWIGTTAYGLYNFENKKFETVDDWRVSPTLPYLKNEVPTSNIISIEADSKGNIWVASSFDYYEFPTQSGGMIRFTKFGGLSVYDGNKFQGDLILSGGESPTDLIIDNQDKVWMTTKAGLFLYQSLLSRIVFHEDFNGLSSDNLTGIVKDKNGVIWITTFDGGLNKYKGEVK